MEADCAAARESLENTEANAALLERRIDEIYAQSQSYTAEIERVRERIAALQEQAQEKRGDISLLRSEIEHGERLPRACWRTCSRTTRKCRILTAR